jgi:hypothetical protein
MLTPVVALQPVDLLDSFTRYFCSSFSPSMRTR